MYKSRKQPASYQKTLIPPTTPRAVSCRSRLLGNVQTLDSLGPCAQCCSLFIITFLCPLRQILTPKLWVFGCVTQSPFHAVATARFLIPRAAPQQYLRTLDLSRTSRPACAKTPIADICSSWSVLQIHDDYLVKCTSIKLLIAFFLGLILPIHQRR